MQLGEQGSIIQNGKNYFSNEPKHKSRGVPQKSQ